MTLADTTSAYPQGWLARVVNKQTVLADSGQIARDVLLQAAVVHEVNHRNPTGQHDEVGHHAAMAAPPHRLGT